MIDKGHAPVILIICRNTYDLLSLKINIVYIRATRVLAETRNYRFMTLHDDTPMIIELQTNVSEI